MILYQKKHKFVNATVLANILADLYPDIEIVSIEVVPEFFGSNAWSIRTRGEGVRGSGVLGALYSPEGILTVRKGTKWPLLPENAPYAKVIVCNGPEEGGQFFYLKPTVPVRDCVDWRLSGSEWPEFEKVFEENEETTFSFGAKMAYAELLEILRRLGFVHIHFGKE